MKIVITGDTQRPSPQFHNILWLHRLINFQIKKLLNINARCLNQTRPLKFEEWMTTTDVPELIGADVYIGFELNDRFKKKCDQENIRYIDVKIHPIRFMDDLVLGLSSNFVDFTPFEVSKDEIQLAAELAKAAVVHVAGVRTVRTTALVVGQTAGDKSVIFDKEYCLDDFDDYLYDRLKNYGLVIYKPHPHASGRPNFLTRLKHVDCVTTNIYRLLASEDIKLVMGLSSSVLCEAKYFGKGTINLVPTWWDKLVPVSSKTFLSFDFWRYCLKDYKPSDFNMEIPYQHSMLRKSARSYWGYDILDKLP